MIIADWLRRNTSPNLGAYFFMKAFILGRKGETIQQFTESGDRIPVSYIYTSPCYIVSLKTNETTGRWTFKLGTGLAKHINKPQQGELKKAGIQTPLRFLREVTMSGEKEMLVEKDGAKGVKLADVELFSGSEIKANTMFKKDDLVTVQGISKGKGFQGVVKRHKFAGGPRTHGQSDRERAPGSIGQTTTPGRVYKGKRMAGRMGNQQTSIKGLRVIEATEDKLTIKGVIPGAQGSFLVITA